MDEEQRVKDPQSYHGAFVEVRVRQGIVEVFCKILVPRFCEDTFATKDKRKAVSYGRERKDRKAV